MFNRKFRTCRAHAVLAWGGDSGTNRWYADHNRQQDEQECHTDCKDGFPSTSVAGRGECMPCIGTPKENLNAAARVAKSAKMNTQCGGTLASATWQRKYVYTLPNPAASGDTSAKSWLIFTLRSEISCDSCESSSLSADVFARTDSGGTNGRTDGWSCVGVLCISLPLWAATTSVSSAGAGSRSPADAMTSREAHRQSTRTRENLPVIVSFNLFLQFVRSTCKGVASDYR
jgi:hypothetical protein